jgi:hypothetical protein
MRLILSRKGFDSSAGGCPSPIFSDGSMIALPIPDKTSRIRYQDLNWRGRNLGDLVVKLTRGKKKRNYGAHLDPDLREDVLKRSPGWRPALGQLGAAQGHLRKQGIRAGDLFLFWGLFRRVDDELNWQGRLEHRVWGWLQIGEVAPVDDVVRTGGKHWGWAKKHPHLEFETDATNTLYVAQDKLSLPGLRRKRLPGAGVFEFADEFRRLTAPDAKTTSEWSMPHGFLPKGRAPLTYHPKPERWEDRGDEARLHVVGRGQEFVLDLEQYPELVEWIGDIVAGT